MRIMSFNQALRKLALEHGMEVDITTSGKPIDLSGEKVDHINGVAVYSVQAEFKPKAKSSNQWQT